MKFDKETHKVDWKSMNKEQAVAFLIFLESEKIRHQEDINEISKLVEEVKHWYDI